MTRTTRRFRNPRAVLGLLALATVAVAPLAGSRSADAVTIGGAETIGDVVHVQVGRFVNPTVDVHVLGFNDFHGQLNANGGVRQYGKYAGGASYLAKAVRDKQDLYGLTNEATVVAGDSVGATPIESAAFSDEPAIIAKNMMRVDFASVGNHEFDMGKTELLRKQNGCVSQPASCSKAKSQGAGDYLLPDGSTTSVFPGANWQYLSANVIDTATSNPLLPAYGIKTLNGVKVGFIGVVLQATPTIVTPSGVAGLSFISEITAANAAATQLKGLGAQTIVLIVHEGGFQTGTAVLNGCAGNLTGSPILTIAAGLDPSIGVIVSGHTHAEYMCTVTTGATTRIIGSAASQGKVLSDYTLTIDTVTGQLVSASGVNAVVESSSVLPNPSNSNYVQDPTKQHALTQQVVTQYTIAVAPVANEVIARITADFTNTAQNPFGEMTAGDLVADAQLAATTTSGGAQIAFMNPGGVRAPGLTYAQSPTLLEGDGNVTFGEAFAMQPFGNSLVTKTMTGAQIRSLLEQQYVGCGGQTTKRILLVSNGFRYETDPTSATCAGKIGLIQLNGVDLSSSQTYRVTMNSFLATGGDGFTVFNSGTDPIGGDLDTDALRAYVKPSLTGTPLTPIALKTTSPVLLSDPNRIVSPGQLVSSPGAVVSEAAHPWLLTVGALFVMGGGIGVVALRRRTKLS